MKRKNAKLVTIILSTVLAASMTACGTKSAQQADANNHIVCGTILLSVNPEIEVNYNQNGQVIDLIGNNEDGTKIIKSFESFENQNCSAVINDLIKKIYEEGYFDNKIAGHDKNIIVKLEEGSNYPDDDFLESIAEGIRETIEECKLSNQLMTIDDDDYDDDGRINVDAARQLILSQLGLSNAEFTDDEYELDDDIYEFEFEVDGIEYEYEVNAQSGKVKEADRLHNDDWKKLDAKNTDDDDDDDDDNDDNDN